MLPDHPLVLLANAAFYAAFAPAFRTARVRFERDPAGLRAAPEEPFRALVYYGWHGDAWAGLMALRHLPDDLRPVNIAHDGILSRLNQHAGRWHGFDTFVFRKNDAVSPRDQIAGYLGSAQRHAVIFVDSGGPYRVMKPGLLEIGRRIDARLVPFRVRSRRAPVVGRRMRHIVPLPFCELTVRLGAPIDAATASIPRCEAALEDLGA